MLGNLGVSLASISVLKDWYSRVSWSHL
jgi:hypothetical protein